MTAALIVVLIVAYLLIGMALATRSLRRLTAECPPVDAEDWLGATFAWFCFSIAWPAFLMFAALAVLVKRLVGGAS